MTRLVATAWRMLKPPNKTRAGTTRKPPPTPTRPVITPTNKPSNEIFHIARGEYARLRKRLPGRRFLQVVHVEDESAIELARDYAEVADALLLDSGRPHAPLAELGGTGRTHDWAVSRDLAAAVPVPVFLAGGGFQHGRYVANDEGKPLCNPKEEVEKWMKNVNFRIESFDQLEVKRGLNINLFMAHWK